MWVFKNNKFWAVIFICIAVSTAGNCIEEFQREEIFALHTPKALLAFPSIEIQKPEDKPGPIPMVEGFVLVRASNRPLKSNSIIHRLPFDLGVYIRTFLDKEASLTFRILDRYCFAIDGEAYQQKQKEDHHKAWQEETLPASLPSQLGYNRYIPPSWRHKTPMSAIPVITPRGMHVFNNCMFALLGLHINIRRGWADELDIQRFNRVYDKIMKAPIFAQDALPMLYAHLLFLDLLHLNLIKPQSNAWISKLSQWFPVSQYHFHSLKQFCKKRLKTITEEKSGRQTNEAALYLHFSRLIGDGLSVLPRLDTFTPSGDGTGFLMDIIKGWLLTAKIESVGPNSLAEKWYQILIREPVVTSKQLKLASEAFQQADDYGNLAVCYERMIEVRKLSGQSPIANDYYNAGLAYYHAESYQNAFRHCQRMLEVLKEANQAPTAEQYLCAGNASFRIGNFSLAAQYLTRSIGIMRAEGGILSVSRYQDVASAHLNAGANKEALTYCVLMLEELKRKRIVPTPYQYLLAAKTYFALADYRNAAAYYARCIEASRVISNSLNANLFQRAGTSYYNIGHYYDAYEYYQEMFNALLRSKKKPTAEQNYFMAFTCFYVGKYGQAAKYWVKYINMSPNSTFEANQNAGAAFFKATNYSEAIRYYKKALGVLQGTQQNPVPEIYDLLSEAYFHKHDYESAAEYYVKFIKTLQTNSTPVTSEHYHRMVHIYFKAGNIAEGVKYSKLVNEWAQR